MCGGCCIAQKRCLGWRRADPVGRHGVLSSAMPSVAGPPAVEGLPFPPALLSDRRDTAWQGPPASRPSLADSEIFRHNAEFTLVSYIRVENCAAHRESVIVAR